MAAASFLHDRNHGGRQRLNASQIPATRQQLTILKGVSLAIDIGIDREDHSVAKTVKRLRLQLGMLAQVTIATARRASLNYLVGPVREPFAAAFRET